MGRFRIIVLMVLIGFGTGCVCEQTGPGSVGNPFVVRFEGVIRGLNSPSASQLPIKLNAQFGPYIDGPRVLAASSFVNTSSGNFNAQSNVTYKDTGAVMHRGQCHVEEDAPETKFLRTLQAAGRNTLSDLTVAVTGEGGDLTLRPESVTITRVSKLNVVVQLVFDVNNPNPNQNGVIPISFSVGALFDLRALAIQP